MTTLHIPDDLEARLTSEASRRGTTPELLALHVLRDGLGTNGAKLSNAASLLDLVQGCVGQVDDSQTSVSSPLQSPFTDLLRDKQKRGHL